MGRGLTSAAGAAQLSAQSLARLEPMSVAAAQAAAFYRDVARTLVVWTIRDEGGFPAPLTTHGVRAMPFWSTRGRAQRIISNVPAYEGFTPVSISWAEFCSKWAPDLKRDGFLVGVNWSGPYATGYDLAPDVVVRNVGAALSRQAG